MALFDPFPTLTTPRLRLRALTLDDAEGMYVTRTHPASVRFSGKAPPASVDAMREKLETILGRMRAEEGISWALEDAESGAYLGSAGLFHWQKPHFRAEVGYELHARVWGRGIMPEALGPIVAFGFERMGLHSIEAKVHPENAASMRVLAKLGFQQEAHLRESHFNGTAFEDTVIFSLLSR